MDEEKQTKSNKVWLFIKKSLFVSAMLRLNQLNPVKSV